MSMYEELVIQTQMNYSRYYEQYQGKDCGAAE